jgi:hypothetical protein
LTEITPLVTVRLKALYLLHLAGNAGSTSALTLEVT